MSKSLKSIFGPHHGLDEKSVNFLIKALDKNNLPGFDYLEFKQALQALQEMDMTEETAYRSAYATATTVGLTREKLLKTADHYKKILANEKVQFDAALQKQVKQRVEGKRSEVEKLRQQIEDYKKKIEQLEAKIVKSQQTIEQQDDLIQSAQDKIETTKDGFERTLQSITNEIDRDIENIESFIPE
jgi:chromosome segregation ATPase